VITDYRLAGGGSGAELLVSLCRVLPSGFAPIVLTGEGEGGYSDGRVCGPGTSG
jgi:hypothetical protein